MKTVSVISTGNELLYGRVLDTNGQFIAARLFGTDCEVRSFTVVGDSRGELAIALKNALDRSDIVIITGGLGPTDDDLTIEALGDLFDLEVSVHGESLDRMVRFFEAVRRDVNESDRKMVQVPAGSRVLLNEKGLPPGFILEPDNRAIIALPGVPGEMRHMFERGVMPYLLEKYGIASRDSLLIRVIGMKETAINAAVLGMGFNAGDITWGITAERGIATVSFVGKAGSLDIPWLEKEARRAFGNGMLSPPFASPEEELLSLMRSRGHTLAAAESCTGGLMAQRITDVAGCSDVFLGSAVVYDNEAKVKILGVSRKTLERFGAVSEETAREMARGARRTMGADAALVTTGIAVPGGGSAEKPVGTVWFGFVADGAENIQMRTFRGDRDMVRRFASIFAVDALRRHYLA